MPKRGSDADSRIFFDELVRVSVSRLRATGAIRLGDECARIPFGEQTKLVGVSHTTFPNGGSWSYFAARSAEPEAESFGSSTMRHAVGCAWKSLACAIVPLTASAEPSA
jgi:hypothetical protein